MKNLRTTLFAAGLSWTLPIFAGVVVEVEITAHGDSPAKKSSMEMMVEQQMVKIVTSGDDPDPGAMIFRGDQSRLLVIDDEQRTYQVLNEEIAAELRDRMGGPMDEQLNMARRKLEKQLGELSEEQRQGLERALGYPEGGAQNIFGEEQQAVEVRKIGDRATHAGLPCVRWDVTRGGETVTELWITDWRHVEDGATLKKAFQNLSEFFDGLAEHGFQDTEGLNFYRYIHEIDGFPVVTRNFSNGELEEESILRRVQRQVLSTKAFELPPGYRLQPMGAFFE